MEDGLGVLVAGALPVGILDAENQDTPLFSGQEPVEEGRPGATDVEISRGGRGEADA